MKKSTFLTALALMLALTMTAQVKPQGVEDVNKVVDNTIDSLEKVRQARVVPGSSRRGSNPVLFLVGNSTMRNGTLGNGNNGQWGWGYYAEDFFDKEKITVENQALGGTSSRSFYRLFWPDIRKALKPGDWVIISIGHNDNGPYDTGRARASIPGVDKDTVLHVNVQEINKGDTTYRAEDVYSYGGYLRRFINETRAAGAFPVLMSLTPRNAWEDGHVVRKPHSEWCRLVAEEQQVPYIDLNDISARKLETFGPEKMNYHFFGDKIHTSKFGAVLNARSAAEGIAACDHPWIAFLKSCLVGVEPPTAEVEREEGKPVVFLTGDSTVKNADKDKDGMWGWGAVAYDIFDPQKITVANCAMAGRSCRTFLNEGRWDKVYNSIQPGDYVLIQFGHNDVGAIDSLKERADITGTADTCHVYKLKSNGRYEVVYSFGWYLRKFINDVREKGATPILVSLTPRNIWRDGHIERRNDSYGKWFREVVEQTGVEFIDVHNITADKYDKMGEKKVAAFFNHDHTHSSLKGAKENAKSVKTGLKQIGSSLVKFLR
ncbi:MAG: rhamnogalacturonan acetylesterase [Prevotella sp.]|nr:rhamnogalacturonan acetylesterase [Prevotella sp.]